MSSTNSSSTKIIFKCDQHAAIISEKLQTFYQENEFFDIILIAGSKSNNISIEAHRVVLCALSEYFLETIRGNLQLASNGNVLELKEIEAAVLKLIIDFMYSSSIELSIESVGAILQTASFLKIKSLIIGCCEFIEKNIDVSNCLSWFQFASKLKLPTLLAKTLECTYHNFEELSKDQEFMKLSEDELKDLLFNHNPYRDLEEDVFLAMVAWINFDKLNREHLMIELLSMVYFEAIRPKFIIENRKSVCRTVETDELICNWLQWHLSPETRPSDDQLNCAAKPRKYKKMKKTKNLAVVKCFRKGKINIETFNAEENAWTIEIETKHPQERTDCQTTVIDGKLIVVPGKVNYGGKKNVECFDLRTFEWTHLPPMKEGQQSLQVAVLNKNFLCCFGEYRFIQSYFCLEMYNFSTNEWHNLPPQPTKLSGFSRIAGRNGILYIMDFICGYLQSYDVSSNNWTLKEIENDPIYDFELAAVDDFLYILRGYKQGEWINTTVKRYNLLNDTWSEMTSLSHARKDFEITVFRNKIIMKDCCNNVDEYNTDNDTWTTLRPLNNDSVPAEKSFICHIPIAYNK